MNSQIQTPTIASTWLAVAEGPITDGLLEWPADLFALTNVILERSEAYRFTLSPVLRKNLVPQMNARRPVQIDLFFNRG